MDNSENDPEFQRLVNEWKVTAYNSKVLATEIEKHEKAGHAQQADKLRKVYAHLFPKEKPPPVYDGSAKSGSRIKNMFQRFRRKPHDTPAPDADKGVESKDESNAKTNDQKEGDSSPSPLTDASPQSSPSESPSDSPAIARPNLSAISRQEKVVHRTSKEEKPYQHSPPESSPSETSPSETSPSDSSIQQKVRHEETPPIPENTRLIMLRPNLSKFRLFARRPKQPPQESSETASPDWKSPSDGEKNASPSSESSPTDSSLGNSESGNFPSPTSAYEREKRKNVKSDSPSPQPQPSPSPSPSPSSSSSSSSSSRPPLPSPTTPSPSPSVTTPSPASSLSPASSSSNSPPPPLGGQSQNAVPRFSGSQQNRNNLEEIYTENQRKMQQLRKKHQQMDGKMTN